jgi:hypothetical protein
MLHAENGLAIDVLERDATERGISGPSANMVTRPPATGRPTRQHARLGCPSW